MARSVRNRALRHRDGRDRRVCDQHAHGEALVDLPNGTDAAAGWTGVAGMAKKGIVIGLAVVLLALIGVFAARRLTKVQ
jgi:hypothetical protein